MPQLLRDRLNAPSPSCGLRSQSGWSGPSSFPQPRRPAGLSCFSPAGQKPLPSSDHMQVFLFPVFCGSTQLCTLVPQGSGPCLSICSISNTTSADSWAVGGGSHTYPYCHQTCRLPFFLWGIVSSWLKVCLSLLERVRKFLCLEASSSPGDLSQVVCLLGGGPST